MLATLEAVIATALLGVGLAAFLQLDYGATKLIGYARTHSTERIDQSLWSAQEIATASCTTTTAPSGVVLRTCTNPRGQTLTMLAR